MPKRPRSHQLETLSEDRFRSLIPEAWVVRRKDFDYGIDLEVELFDEHENSTGLMFYVQLKATDDKARRNHISLKKDSRAYYRSLIIPTMLVRYCAADTSTHWKWHFDIPDIAEGQESQKIEFTDSDLWSEITNSRIEEALRLWRRLRNQRPNQTVPLYLDVELLHPEQRQPSRSMVRKLVDESGALGWQDDLTQDIVLTLHLRPNQIAVSLGRVSSLTLLYPIKGGGEAAIQIRYLIAAFLNQIELQHHANMVANDCMEANAPCISKDVAIWTCQALLSDPVKATNLAIINGLHEPHDVYPAIFMQHLMHHPFSYKDRRKSMLIFINQQLKMAIELKNNDLEGLAYYALGNYYSNEFSFYKAINFFNKARKKRPRYMESGYFLSEIGSILFGSTHYVGAAEFYTRSYALKRDQRLALRLGDALLLKGNFSEAALRFREAQSGNDPGIRAESELKGILAKWLEGKHGPAVVRKRSAVLRLPRTGEMNESLVILRDFDAMDVLSHWNFGTVLANQENYGEALYHFLICAFVKSSDREAWTNALICSMNVGDAATIQRVLSCCLVLGGAEMADDFCARLSGQPRLVESFTNAIGELCKTLGVGRGIKPTLRILDDDTKASEITVY